MRKYLPHFIIAAYLFTSIFAVSFVFSSAVEHIHCPILKECLTSVGHIEHWKNALTTLVIALFALVLFFAIERRVFSEKSIFLHTFARAYPARNLKTQESYSNGILNRKAP